MSAIPYVGAVVIMIFLAHSSDRLGDRAYHAIAGASICLIGYVLLISFTSREALFTAVCIAVSGIFVINPVVNAWLTSNISPDMKKSVATAMAVSANNSAGLVGSNIYRASDAPRYIRGHTINIVFISLCIILIGLQRFLLRRQNIIRDERRKQSEADTLEETNRNHDVADDGAIDFDYRL
ncbi:hypothetical protein EC973_007860 [Apophysomyces ossiformis]|uniref:MFS transporter n=1 Tax=Apophysomyces ossiformis TaxID=679940 RepID=A0A8H7BUK2_9FUNG|nr:hypothetical protein EC973_007860 [Apophysomyces ossiformis]